MLDADDTIVLASGVRRDPAMLVDDVRCSRYPLNATAELVLDRAGEPLAEAVEELVERWGVTESTARHDVLRFAWTLNSSGLVNVRRTGPRRRRVLAWLRVALRTLPSGRLPEATVERREVDTRSVGRAVVSTARALGRRGSALAAAAFSVLCVIGSLAGNASVVAAAVVAGALGAAVLLHEGAHVAALRGVPAALLLVRGRVSVVHRPLGDSRALLVALAGPATPALAAAGLATASLWTGSALVALCACPAASHALAATVAGRDGRIACLLVTARSREEPA